MDELRKKRYRDKINYIVESLPYITIEFSKEIEKRGSYYSIQTSIESLMDILAMLVKDYGLVVKSDAENVRTLINHKNINFKMGEELITANGLRNLLVHRYNGIDETIIMDSIKEIRNLIEIWLKKIEMLVNELSNLE